MNRIADSFGQRIHIPQVCDGDMAPYRGRSLHQGIAISILCVDTAKNGYMRVIPHVMKHHVGVPGVTPHHFGVENALGYDMATASPSILPYSPGDKPDVSVPIFEPREGEQGLGGPHNRTLLEGR